MLVHQPLLREKKKRGYYRLLCLTVRGHAEAGDPQIIQDLKVIYVRLKIRTPHTQNVWCRKCEMDTRACSTRKRRWRRTRATVIVSYKRCLEAYESFLLFAMDVMWSVNVLHILTSVAEAEAGLQSFLQRIDLNTQFFFNFHALHLFFFVHVALVLLQIVHINLVDASSFIYV